MEEISNEERVRVFLAHLGCSVIYGYNGRERRGVVTGNSATDGLEIFDSRRTTHLHHNVDPILCALLLTPLSKISDEDAIEVARTGRANFMTDHAGIHSGKQLVFELWDQHPHIRPDRVVEITDYLRPKGYNCGYAQYSPDDLVEMGVVVYEKEGV